MKKQKIFVILFNSTSDFKKGHCCLGDDITVVEVKGNKQKIFAWFEIDSINIPFNKQSKTIVEKIRQWIG